MPAVGLTDRANLFGALEFSVATKGAGVQPIVGVALPMLLFGFGMAVWSKVGAAFLDETGKHEFGWIDGAHGAEHLRLHHRYAVISTPR